MSDIEMMNEFGVGTHGDDVVILAPPHRCTKEQALRFAAWLVVLAEEGLGEFNAVLEAVKNT